MTFVRVLAAWLLLAAVAAVPLAPATANGAKDQDQPAPAGPETPAMPERGDPFTTPIVPIPDPEPTSAAADGPQVEQLPVLELAVGAMEIVRLPAPATTFISTFPGVVTLGSEQPGLLFIFAERPGETQVVVADSEYNQLFVSTIRVLPDGGS